MEDIECKNLVINNIKKEANETIRKNLMNMSKSFKTHESVLMSIYDDILFSDNDYFTIQTSQANQISNGCVNSFRLTTTAIYTGISLDCNVTKMKTFSPEYCIIYFDDHQNITSFKFQINKMAGNKQMEFIELMFNKNSDLIHLDWKYRINEDIKAKQFNTKGLTILEIIELIILKFNMNESINALLPELNVPSAYDFNSAEFKDRLLLAKMLLM